MKNVMCASCAWFLVEEVFAQVGLVFEKGERIYVEQKVRNRHRMNRISVLKGRACA